MHDFDNFMVTCRLGDHGQKWMTFRADFNDKDKGSLWFMFDLADFKRLIYSWDDATGDGYHCVKKSGSELWMFFDLETPRVPFSKKEISVRIVQMPPRVSKILLRYAQLVFRKLRRRLPEDHWSAKPDEMVFELTMARRVRWADAYGCGKGDVEVIVDERAKKLYDTRKTDEKLQERIDGLKTVARNTTSTKWQTAQLRLSPDSERGLYFLVVDAQGNRSMNGAIVDHGTPEAPEWLVHT